MGKLKIHGCSRCKGGEVYIEGDQYGWYECCLQCGYTRDLPDTAPVTPIEWPNTGEKEAVPAIDPRLMVVRK